MRKTNMAEWLLTELQIMMIPVRTRCLRHDRIYIHNSPHLINCPDCFKEMKDELDKIGKLT